MVKNITKKSTSEELARWNDEMVSKYHKKGTLFESKNPMIRLAEKERLKSIIRLANIKKADHVLDIGCGEGYIFTLMPKAARVVGIDISKVALEGAKRLVSKKNLRVELYQDDAQNLKITDKFDKIMSSEVLEHVPDPERVIRNIHSILKPNGVLVVSIPDEKRIQKIMSFLKLTGIDRFLHSARKHKDYEWHLHDSDIKFLKRIIKGYFRIAKIKRTPFITGHRFVAKLYKI